MACSLHRWGSSLSGTVCCLNIFAVNGIPKGQGDGASKQLAKEEAARQAYYAMGWAPRKYLPDSRLTVYAHVEFPRCFLNSEDFWWTRLAFTLIYLFYTALQSIEWLPVAPTVIIHAAISNGVSMTVGAGSGQYLAELQLQHILVCSTHLLHEPVDDPANTSLCRLLTKDVRRLASRAPSWLCCLFVKSTYDM